MSLSGARVLVTGASGFLGGTLTRRLADEGAYVRALVRTPSKADFLHDAANVAICAGDVTDRQGLRRAVEGCVYVFHCAAAFTDWETQRAVNVDGTRNVAELCAEANVQRLVHVSTIAVYGYRPTHDIRETDSLLPSQGDPYNLTKIQGERAVTAVAQSHGLSVSIIRPGQMYGPRGGMWTQTLFRIANQPRVLFAGGGSGSIHLIHIDDVADLMVTLATHPEAHNQAFNCTPDPAPTWREVLLAYRTLSGRTDDHWFGLPVTPILAATKLAATFAPAHHQLRDAPDLLGMMQRRFSFSNAKARDLLGWTPRVPLSEGVASCAPWLRAQGLLR